MKKFEIPEIYKSNVISQIKEIRRVKDRLKKDFTPTTLKFENVTVLLARHFGFCYGVENAVEIAYKTIEEHRDKRVFFLSEMIHNPEVNADLLSRGVRFIMDTKGGQLVPWENLTNEDIVVVPAFGTTLEIQKRLEDLGINPYKFDTTCPFVEKVWNRASQIGERGYSVIVHGKPDHEETRATFSHSKASTPTVVVKDLVEAQNLALYIEGKKPKEQFFEEFKGQHSDGFDPNIHLQKIGVVNQTTMLASDTQEISDFLKQVIMKHYDLDNDSSQTRFANTRDTLCYATNDNQDATKALIQIDADIAIVVGGYNSSNTQHLVELCEKDLKTFFISSHNCLLDDTYIQHYDMHKQQELVTKDYLPLKENPVILLTCGASCPDAIMEAVLLQLLDFYNNKNELMSVVDKLESQEN